MSDELPKHPGGRPTKYRPEYCEELVAFCREGYSITGFAGEIGVGRETISEWARVHPEFSVAVSRAKAAATRAYEGDARHVRQHGGGGGQATLIIFGLKNMAPDDYADKQEHLIGGNGKEPVRAEVIYSGALARGDENA